MLYVTSHKVFNLGFSTCLMVENLPLMISKFDLKLHTIV